jgi:hypothetical protein
MMDMAASKIIELEFRRADCSNPKGLHEKPLFTDFDLS